MSFLELAKKRQSDRMYIDKPVEREKIERCLEAARLAPSACNSQPWSFIVVDDPELKEKAARATFGKLINFNHFTLTSPVMIVMITGSSNWSATLGNAIKGQEFNKIDIGIAAEHFCLQAADEGLGTCMLGWFDQNALKKVLNIPKARRIDLVITLGYSDDSPRDKKRKSLDEMFKYNLD